MAVAYLDSGSIINLTVGNTLSANTVASAQSGSLNVAIAGGVSTQISQLVFSNANNHTFGLVGNTLTVNYAEPVRSYYENMPAIQGTQTINFAGSTNFVQPFALPYNLSASYIRFLMTNVYQSTSVGITANISAAFTQGQTWFVNIYSLGTGTNSSRLEQVTSTSATMEIRASFTNSTNNQSNSVNITFPVTGSTASTQITTQTTVGSFIMHTSAFSANFNTNRFLDVPFATSLSAGQYWIALQKSSSTNTAGNTAGVNVISNYRYNNSLFAVSQITSGFGSMGVTGTTAPLQVGNGSISFTAAGTGTLVSTLALSNITGVSSHLRMPFQMARIV